MSNKKFEDEDLKRIKEFQETILNLNEEEAPKYSVDYEMEAQIKYDVLIDNFGVEAVNEAFKILDVSKEDLSDHPSYLDIYGYLEAKSKQGN